MIAREVYDERASDHVQQSLRRHIEPICEAVLQSKVHAAPLTATSLHLWTQICVFIRGYAFHLCSRPQLLQQCLRYMVEVPVSTQPVMAYECSRTFNSLLYHSASAMMQQLGDFEKIVQFVTESVGRGRVFWGNLKQNEVALLRDMAITETDTSVISRQQSACAMYYEACCTIIDVYSDRKRQSALINQLMLAPTEQCDVILKGNTSSIARGDLQQIAQCLRIFSGFVRGLKVRMESPIYSDSKMSRLKG